MIALKATMLDWVSILAVFFRALRLNQMRIQVTTPDVWDKQGIYRKFFIVNRFHVTLKIASP